MPRRSVLTDAQAEALLALPTAETDLIRHYTLSPADIAVVARRRRPHNQLGFAVQLCALRYPGRLLRPGELVPPQVLSFVADQLDLPPDALAEYATRSQTRYDQLEALYAIYGYATFSQPIRREIAKWLLPVALATTSGMVLAGLLMEELRRRTIAAPAASTIERLVATALLQAERHVERQIDAALTVEQREGIDGLLVERADTGMSLLAWARHPPGATGHRAMTRLTEQLSVLRALGIDPAIRESIHVDRVHLLIREGGRLSSQHLSALAPLRRQSILTMTVLETITRLTDDIIGMFDRLIGGLFRRAERRAAETIQANSRAMNEKVRLLARVGEALIDARGKGTDAFAAIEAVIPWEKFKAAVAEAGELTRDDGTDYAALAATNHALLRRVGPLFLDSFSFHGIAGVGALLNALALMRTFYAGSRRNLPKGLPTGFIRRTWRAAVLRGDGINAPAYELCLFVELRDRLRAGDVWVAGSRQYRAVEDQLVPKTLFSTMKLAGPLPVAVQEEAIGYLRERRELLEERLRHVDGQAAKQLLPDVKVNGTALKISPLQAVTPEAADQLADRIQAVMPRVRITELLTEVNRWTGMIDCFTHLRTQLPADDPRITLTAVLADATNLGLTRMAEACDLATYRQLAWAAGWHLSEENYGRALARVTAAQHAHPLSAWFGDASVSSSDGQHFPLGGQGEVAGAVNPHKGTGPAISFYTWISGRYAPFHTKVISVSEGEAAHVIDGLLYHGGDIDIAVHHTDGGGVSDHVFGLCHLLGFRFAPRIPNIANRRLHTFGPASTWPALEPFIAARIDETMITTHWDDLLRLATSVRMGTVPASLMLRRLGSYPRQNGLALALREVGRIERTLFTLDWLDDPMLRRQATAELNKGESRNALARAVCFHRLGRLRDRTLESRQHRASGLNLVLASIILWNTVYMDRVIRFLRGQGEDISDNLLPYLAPLGWQHINLTGDYLWAEPARLDKDGYRMLRIPTERLTT